MSDDLIKRLRDRHEVFDLKSDLGWRPSSITNEAADRIERLERENARLDAGWGDANVRALDAGLKLAKAVEALRDTTQMLSQCTFTIIRIRGQYFERQEVVDKVNAVLAELEGKE